MCIFCERRQDVKFGWDQPKLPYHRNLLDGSSLNGNVLENEKWDGAIHDYQTTTPELVLTCPGYFDGEGIGTIHIPIKYCPECGRKLGKDSSGQSLEKRIIEELNKARFPITDLKQGVIVNGIQQTDDAVLYDRAIEIVREEFKEEK